MAVGSSQVLLFRFPQSTDPLTRQQEFEAEFKRWLHALEFKRTIVVLPEGSTGHTGTVDVVVDLDYNSSTGVLSQDVKTLTLVNGVLTTVSGESTSTIVTFEAC
jgi:hypothetical protein